MKKNAFTLIELLAVILILGIIALIAIPTITKILDESKMGAFSSSTTEIAKIIEQECQVSIIKNTGMVTEYRFEDGESLPSIPVKGQLPDKGYAVVNKDCQVSFNLENNEYLSTKTYEEDRVNVINKKKSKVYGLKWDGNDVYTRLDDALGMTANVGVDQTTPKNDFDNAEIYKDMVDVEDTYGNQFVTIPKFYIKKTVTGDVWEWRISKVKKDKDYYLPSCFYDEVNSKELPYILVGKYDASETGGKLESKTGVKPLVDRNIDQFRTLATSNNQSGVTGYQLLDIHALDAIQVLFYIEFATLNSQNLMFGYAKGNAESIVSGTTDVVTASSGSKTSNTDGQNAMKYRGIENIYGNVWQVIDGINVDNTNSDFYISKDASKYVSSNFTGSYSIISGYKKLNTDGFVTKMGYDSNFPFLQMPLTVGGNAGVKYGDYYYQNADQGNKVLLFGGRWTNDSSVGISHFYLNYSSTRGELNVGSRLLKTAL
ncbi:MAG: prepilin-type N-terminal cleavage/methylation domain-containing protein [Bacilli bacterium]